ncbi:hypothetical protein Nepgr_006670 [Nepenthes gracilis]|uniref:Uncharacterized protein n=1 Tax=Nepenthes gracilis TaxID=150966 RepID=A0AAD3XHN3_NEPGR|nr:hypothetical protein Nepgr_006670 [Nepenthes gracilis]
MAGCLGVSSRSPVVPSKSDLVVLPSQLRVLQFECPQLPSSSDSPHFPPSWLPFGRPISTPLLVRRRWINWLFHIPRCPFPIMLNPLLSANLAPRSQVTPLSSFPGSDGSDMKAGHFPSLRAANSPKDVQPVFSSSSLRSWLLLIEWGCSPELVFSGVKWGCSGEMMLLQLVPDWIGVFDLLQGSLLKGPW